MTNTDLDAVSQACPWALAPARRSRCHPSYQWTGHILRAAGCQPTVEATPVLSGWACPRNGPPHTTIPHPPVLTLCHRRIPPNRPSAQTPSFSSSSRPPLFLRGSFRTLQRTIHCTIHQLLLWAGGLQRFCTVLWLLCPRPRHEDRVIHQGMPNPPNLLKETAEVDGTLPLHVEGIKQDVEVALQKVVWAGWGTRTHRGGRREGIQ